MERARIQTEDEETNRLLTTADVCKFLRKTPMMVYLYRKNKSMPFVELPGGMSANAKKPIRFYEKDVRRWAKENNIPFYSV